AHVPEPSPAAAAPPRAPAPPGHRSGRRRKPGLSGEPPRPGADLKAAVEALRRRTQQYRLLAEQAADGVLLVTPDGRIAAATASACALFAWPRAEVLRRRVRDLFADEADRDREWDALLHMTGSRKRECP